MAGGVTRSCFTFLTTRLLTSARSAVSVATSASSRISSTDLPTKISRYPKYTSEGVTLSPSALKMILGSSLAGLYQAITDSYRRYSDYTVSLRRTGDISITIEDDGDISYPSEIEQYWKPKKT